MRYLVKYKLNVSLGVCCRKLCCMPRLKLKNAHTEVIKILLPKLCLAYIVMLICQVRWKVYCTPIIKICRKANYVFYKFKVTSALHKKRIFKFWWDYPQWETSALFVFLCFYAYLYYIEPIWQQLFREEYIMWKRNLLWLPSRKKQDEQILLW